MAAHDDERLIKLGDTDETVADPAEDIRGRDVVDTDGEDIGKVNDLLIDETERKVRFIEIASGGFLGMGKDTLLIPVDAITSITDDEVILAQTREHIADAPTCDPDAVLERDTYTEVLGYYGYAPRWEAGYQYPAYPRYGWL